MVIKYQPKEASQYICSSVILIDSVFRTSKIYYPQMVLGECEYVVKEEKMPKYIIKDIEISSNESGKGDFNEENSDEVSSGENSDEENHIKE